MSDDRFLTTEYIKGSKPFEPIGPQPEKICPNHGEPMHVSVGWYGAKYECYDCLRDYATGIDQPMTSEDHRP